MQKNHHSTSLVQKWITVTSAERESSKLRWRRNHKHTPFSHVQIQKYPSIKACFRLIFLSNIFWASKNSPNSQENQHAHTHTYPFQFSHKLRNPNIFKAFNIYFSFQTFSENPNIDPRKADIIYLFDKSKLTKSELSANVNLFSNRAAHMH